MQESLSMLRGSDLEHEDTLIVALTFRCNSRCRFCIVETEIANRVDDTDERVLERVFEANAESQDFTRLVLTGAEVTLLPNLPALASAATDRGGFSTVRIQTNARKLKDPQLVRSLVAAGIGEYFVSIHAHTAELDNLMTKSPPSFAEMQAGVANLLDAGARVISNTVMTSDNLRHLPEIAAFITSLGVRESHLWNFLNIGDAGQHAQLVPLSEGIPYVLGALDVWADAEVETVVKWLPKCLLGRHGELLDNHQPQMLIRDEFQKRMGTNFGFDCVHAQRCSAFGRGCDGLHEGYVRALGDERDLLRPFE